MRHFGVLCYHGAGHLNPLIALSNELVSRGHRITFFLPHECESRIRQHGFGFFPIDVSRDTTNSGDIEAAPRQASAWVEDIRLRLCRLDQEIGAYIREYCAAVSDAAVDALLMGEITLAGPTVAEMLRIPYFVISTSIPHNFGWSVPRVLLQNRTRQEEVRARIFEATIPCISSPIRQILDRYRHQSGLGSVEDIGSTFPELAHITQWPRCLDTPRQRLPERFFYTGPFVDARTRSPVEFPWHKLNGQPLVYTSLGTTRKADPELFHRIASACVGLDLQLVLTLGGRRNLEAFAKLPGNPLVVGNAPQLELLERADLVITHAGPNTVLETLLCGKPMLALPIALDQPAVAAHLERLGVAEVLSPHCSQDDIRNAVLKVRNESRYSEAACMIQAKLQSLDGVGQAVSIVEEALANRCRSLESLALQ